MFVPIINLFQRNGQIKAMTTKLMYINISRQKYMTYALQKEDVACWETCVQETFLLVATW